MKKILFVGVFSQSHSNNIPQVEILRKRGFTVDTFDYRAISASKRTSFLDKKVDVITNVLHHKLFLNPFRQVYFKEKGRKHLQVELIKSSKKKYDIIFISKGEEISPATLDILKENSKIYYYFMDPIGTAHTIQAEKLAQKADYSSATTSLSVQYFKDHGANVALIPQGIDPGLYNHLPRTKNYDVIFVGSMTGKRKKYVQALLKAGISVEVFGPNTKNGPIYRRELMEKYAQSRIILNFVREEGGFSVRVYQAMATGTIVLTEYCTDLKKYFTRKKHLDWFSSIDESISLVKYYLKNEKKRELIAQKGRDLVSSKYTWSDQISHIVEFIEQ